MNGGRRSMALVVLLLSAMMAFGESMPDYYKNANGKKGAALKTALCGIIYNHTERSYNDLWTDYYTTDVRSDGKIWDMYSNITNFRPGKDQAGSYSGEGDVYNREHSFPKSWFGGEVPPMYTDLNHLYPTDGYVNNKRSNYPFGETKGESYKSANGFSKLGKCTYPGYSGTVFEPNDEYKGDFARTYFYMVTCYEEKLPDWYRNNNESRPTLDGNEYPGLSSWQLAMLMEWAKKDPVSAKETNRNNAVYSIQKNRNPFIDYPGLEEYIWGSMKDVAFSYDHYVQPDNTLQYVTMSFSPASVTATIGEDFTEPTLTTNPAGLAVTYASSAPSVATVNETTGEVTLVAAGVTTITAIFAGNDTYNRGTASYTLTVKSDSGQPSLAGDTLLYEGLSKYSGNDGSSEIKTNDSNLDYSKWTALTKVFKGSSDFAYANGGCLKLGSGSAIGMMTTDDISLKGNGILTFYLKQYSSDTGKLNVKVEGATADVTEFDAASAWKLCTVNLTNASGSVTITLTTSSGRVYVDEITLVKRSETPTVLDIALADDDSQIPIGSKNADIIATNASKTANVTLSGRTLYKDGEWNTLCLPFDVTLEGSPLAGATAKTLTDATMTGTHITLTFGQAVTTLKAGTPYLIKWGSDEGEDIVNPVFTGVTIDSRTDRNITKADGHVSFIGYYDAFTVTPSDDYIYYMTAGNQLKHTAKERVLKACRAYFQFSDEAKSKPFVLDFAEENSATGIDIVGSATAKEKTGDWYTINGVRIEKPVRKGLYILNGQKVVIK